ncbi:MAG: deoxyribodipyrimidine photo-lyase, partial [Acidimicrobiales bacterium]
MATGVWFRRDLRIEDNGAVARAIESASSRGEGTFGVFVYDPLILSQSMSHHRLSYLRGALEALDRRMEGALNTEYGDPLTVLPEWCERNGITDLYLAEDFSGASRRRDRAVGDELSRRGVRMHVVDQPTVAPVGSILKPDGTPYQVFTPYFKAWRAKLMPVEEDLTPTTLKWRFASKVALPAILAEVPADDAAGEEGARSKWEDYKRGGLSSYGE